MTNSSTPAPRFPGIASHATFLARITLILCWVLSVLPAQSAELVQVTWATTNASNPPDLPAPASNYLPAFRLAIQALPESSTVALALSQPAILNLTTEQASRLQPLTAARYRLMAQSE